MLRRACRFLVKTELVANRIRKSGERAHVRANVSARGQHLPTRRLNLSQRFSNTVDHDVHARALIRPVVALLDPGSAHATRVIEREVTVTPWSNFPPENA